MNFLFFLPVLLGLSVVTQGVLNRSVSNDWGLSSTVFLNAIVFLVISFVLLLTTNYYPQILPEYLKIQSFQADKFKLWFLIPGICGVIIVLGVPWSLQINGPTKTFIILIVSQIILSLLVEKFIFNTSISNLKMLGALFAMFGAALATIG